jgi:chemotaxis protein MotB
MRMEAERLSEIAEAMRRRRRTMRSGAAAAAAVVIFAIPLGLLLRAGGSPHAGTGEVIDSTVAAAEPARAAATQDLQAVSDQGETTNLRSLLSRLSDLATVRAEEDGADLRLVFVDGLFGMGSDEPSESGYAALGQVARILAGEGDSLHVEVLGVTDNISPPSGGGWTDNWSLGLSRARAAVEFMRMEAASQHIHWLAASSGDADTPFPNDTEANRAKNRTVVLSVRR